VLTRKEFLRRSLGALAGAVAAGSGWPGRLLSAAAAPEPRGKSRLVIACDPAVWRKGAGIDSEVVKRMLSDSMVRFTGKKTAADAWKSLFKATDVVGIKVNCLFGAGVSTRPEVAFAVASGLRSAGVPDRNIIIWDREDGHLAHGGYQINRDGDGVRCYGTNGNYDTKEVTVSGKAERISRILTEQVTALVSVPILKHHGISGITCAMKNHFGTCDNPGALHGNHGDPFLADLNALPIIKEKTRLIVCDAVQPVPDKGPGNGKDRWAYCGLLVGTDPVAMDWQGWQIIDERRQEVGMATLAEGGPRPTWIHTAAERGIGTDDPAQMDVIRIG
jgi:uncharacterized protein (DUF362 family)